MAVLDGLLFSNPIVRGAALEALDAVPALTDGLSIEDDKISALLMLAVHDVDPNNAQRAQELIDVSGTSARPEQMQTLLPLIGHSHQDIRQAAIGALVQLLETYPDLIQDLISHVTSAIKSATHFPEI